MQPHVLSKHNPADISVTEAELGEHPLDVELQKALDAAFGPDDLAKLDEEDDRRARRAMWMLALFALSCFLAALLLFIILDPQQRIHSAIAMSLFGENV